MTYARAFPIAKWKRSSLGRADPRMSPWATAPYTYQASFYITALIYMFMAANHRQLIRRLYGMPNGIWAGNGCTGS